MTTTSRHALRFLVPLAVLALRPGPASAYPVKMPVRGDSLPEDTYMVTDGHVGYECAPDTPIEDRACSLDINALRWDAGSDNWTRWRPGTDATPTFQDDVMWDMPLYAPDDGVILGCWRRMPDDDVDGDQVNCPGGAAACMAGGNHLTILTSDGHLISLNHLRDDSIPASLCPIADEYIYNTEPKTCTLPAPWDGLRDGARLDLRGIAPIPVKKGQFLGRVGTSGQGVGVHLHMSVSEYQFDGVNPCTSPSEQLEFVESWYQPRSVGVAPSESWTKLGTTSDLPVDGSDYILWPDPIGPRTDTAVLAGGQLPALVMRSSLGAVAFRNTAGNLEVSALSVGGGNITVQQTHEEGAVSRVALTGINSGDHVVAAVRNGSGNLEVIPYQRSGSSLVRGSGRTEGAASIVAATPSPFASGFLVAVRNGSNRMSLIDYSVTSRDGGLDVVRNDSETTSSAISDVDVAAVTAGRALDEGTGALFKGVVTVERRSADSAALVRTWSVDAAGELALRDVRLARDAGSNDIFPVADVEVAVVGTSRQFAVVSTRLLSGGALRTQTWEISSTGILTRLDQADAGTIGVLASASIGSADLVTAAASSSGDLTAVSWQVAAQTASTQGGTIRRGGTRDAGAISAVSVAYSSAAYLLFAVRDSDQQIKLLAYRTNYSALE